ncbi:MAG TPA: hypothetical protein VFA15_09415 [Nitrososphaera sp.]|nr:hypothetical protein [Nitrososphaera sp.]
MEIIESLAWIAIGFCPTLAALHIRQRIAAKRKKGGVKAARLGPRGLAGEAASKLKATMEPWQPALLMQGHGLEEADFEGFARLPALD